MDGWMDRRVFRWKHTEIKAHRLTKSGAVKSYRNDFSLLFKLYPNFDKLSNEFLFGLF